MLTEEKSAWVQGMIVREAGIELVQTRQSKRASERGALYTKDQTLQERLQKQANYGRPKVPKTVKFDDNDAMVIDDSHE